MERRDYVVIFAVSAIAVCIYFKPGLPAPVQSEDEAVARKMKQARENAQQSFHLQAAEYVERIMKPKEEEKRRKKEMLFKRSFSNTAREGHILGNDNTSDAEWNTTVADESLAETIRQHRSRLLDRMERKTELPVEPEVGEDGVITIALRTPDSQTHKRRFRVSDFVKNVVAYMEAIGYSHSSYSLLLPFPRRCISDSLDSSLLELGIVSDSSLIVDLND